MRRFEFECQNCGWKTENIGEKHFCPKDEKNKVDGTYGIQCHADRLATLHEALVTAVEALKWIKPILHGEELQHAEDVLLKIDKVLEEK